MDYKYHNNYNRAEEMLRMSVKQETSLTFSVLVIALASLFASDPILGNQQALPGAEAEQPGAEAERRAEAAEAERTGGREVAREAGGGSSRGRSLPAAEAAEGGFSGTGGGALGWRR